jgi:hypothetical protein
VAREGELARARDLLSAAVGDRPVRKLAAERSTSVALAPYVALAGLGLVLWLVCAPARLPVLRRGRTMASA